MRTHNKNLGSLGCDTLSTSAPPIRARAMGALEIGEVSVETLNPFAVLSAAAQGIVDGLASSSVEDANAAGDNVGATADGSGSISMSDFKNVGGVCKPMNFPALNYAKSLQAQMNRVAQVKGWSKIGVDGAIGPAVLALYTKIKAAAFPPLMGDTSSCAYIAADADVLADQVRQMADSLNAPPSVSGPATPAPSIVTKSGKTVIAPPAAGSIGVAAIDGAFGGMSGGQKVVFAGLVGGIGYVLYKKSHKKGRRK